MFHYLFIISYISIDLCTNSLFFVQARFKLDEEWQKITIFQQMGCIFRSSKARLVKQIVEAKSKEGRLQMKPDNIRSLKEWNDFVNLKTSSNFKVIYI